MPMTAGSVEISCPRQAVIHSVYNQAATQHSQAKGFYVGN